MKRIHEGCLAMYVSDKPDSPNTGKIVRVGKPIGQMEVVEDNGFYWEVDKLISFIDIKNNSEVFHKFAPEIHLIPIDDDNETAQNNDYEVLESTD